MKTEYSQQLREECLTQSTMVATAVSPGEVGKFASERIVRRLDALGAQVNLALGTMVSGMNEHIHDHGTAIGIVTALPRRNVPGALKLLWSDLWQRVEHVVERLIEHLQHVLFVGRGRFRQIERERWLDPGDLVKPEYVRQRNVKHL